MQVKFLEKSVVSDYKFKTKPYKHQYDVFMKSRHKESYALFMEQGTGKSKVIIDNVAYLFRLGKIDHVIVVAPKGVYRNWINQEYEIHMPDDVKEFTDIELWSPSLTKTNLDRLTNFLMPSHRLKFFIINIEALSSEKGKNYLERFLNIGKCFFVIDESTTIKNRSARRTKTCLKLARLAKYRRILTGTPVTRGPLDLWSQIHFLDEYIFQNSFYAYRNTYCVVNRRRLSTHTFDEIIGYQRLDELQEVLKPHSFRVTKKECLDLPDKVYQQREIEMTVDQKKMYNVLKNQAILELEKYKTVTAPLVITRILRLQQILCGYIKYDNGKIEDIKGPNPRLEELLSLLEEIDGNVIIWATFRRSIEMIQEALAKKYGVEKVASYYGGTAAEERQEIVNAFQKGTIRYFIGQPRTGGFGLTLTKAKTVIYFNNTYDLEIRSQSDDRAHRIGQDEKVTYIDFVCPKTIDERILKVLKNKKRLADEITGDNWKELFS